MAKPRTINLAEQEETEESSNGMVDVDPSDQRLHTLMTSLGTGAKIRIYRKPPGAVKEYHCETVPVEGFEVESLREFGGGDYRLQFLNAGGVIQGQVTHSIDPRIKGKLDQAEAQKAPVESPALTMAIEKLTAFQPPPPQDNSILIAMMNQQSQVLQALIANMSKPVPPPPPPANNDALIKALLELAMKREQASPLKDTIEAMAAIRELTEKNEEDDSMLKTLLKTAGPLLGQALMSKVGSPQPAAEAQPAQVTNGGPTPEQMEFAKQQRVWLQRLLTAAKANEDPDFYAEMAERLLPDAVYDQLLAILEKPEWFELLFAGNAEVRAEVEPHKAWFEGLRRLLLAEDEAIAT